MRHLTKLASLLLIVFQTSLFAMELVRDEATQRVLQGENYFKSIRHKLQGPYESFFRNVEEKNLNLQECVKPNYISKEVDQLLSERPYVTETGAVYFRYQGIHPVLGKGVIIDRSGELWSAPVSIDYDNNNDRCMRFNKSDVAKKENIKCRVPEIEKYEALAKDGAHKVIPYFSRKTLWSSTTKSHTFTGYFTLVVSVFNGSTGEVDNDSFQSVSGTKWGQCVCSWPRIEPK